MYKMHYWYYIYQLLYCTRLVNYKDTLKLTHY